MFGNSSRPLLLIRLEIVFVCIPLSFSLYFVWHFVRLIFRNSSWPLVLIGFQIATKRLCHFDQVDKKTNGQFRKMPEMRSKLTPNFLHNLRRVALAAVTRHQLLLHNPCHHRGHPHHNHHHRHHWNANCSQKRGEFGLVLLLGGAPDESGRHAPLYFRTGATRARFVIYNLWFLIVNLQFAICESERHALLFFRTRAELHGTDTLLVTWILFSWAKRTPTPSPPCFSWG